MDPLVVDRRRAAATGVVWSLALALGIWLGRRPRAARSGDPEVWVADRAEGRLVGLNRSLRPVASLEVESPARVVWDQDGTVWALANARLLGLRSDGLRTVAPPVGDVQDVAPLRGGGVVVLARGGVLWRCDSTGGSRRLLVIGGATRVAAGDSRNGKSQRVLVATQGGWLAVLDAGPHPAVVGRVRIQGAFLELAPTTGGKEGWWLLEAPAGPREGRRRLTRLGPHGSELWSRSAPAGAGRLTPSVDGVWMLDPARSGLAQVGHEANQVGWIELPPALRSPSALATSGHGLVLATPGALVALAGNGRVVGSQGGFADLVDLALREARRGCGELSRRPG